MNWVFTRISQKTAFFIVTVVKTSHLTSFTLSLWFQINFFPSCLHSPLHLTYFPHIPLLPLNVDLMARVQMFVALYSSVNLQWNFVSYTAEQILVCWLWVSGKKPRLHCIAFPSCDNFKALSFGRIFRSAQTRLESRSGTSGSIKASSEGRPKLQINGNKRNRLERALSVMQTWMFSVSYFILVSHSELGPHCRSSRLYVIK
jgi:hypothetical protein